MNAVMTINVVVNARAAQAQLKALNAQTAALGATAGGAGAAGWRKWNAGLVTGMRHMEKFGKNLQWTGRQLEFSFTLPLVIAGAAATKWALDNERAMTSVRKVYGDGTESAKQLKAETDALAVSFELLSSRFGVNQEEVINVGAEWAQAGSAGVALAKATRLTMEAMVLGQMDSQRATEGLIAVQSIFRLSTDELRDAMEILNAVENQTATDMEDLIVAFQRSGGTARVAGVDIRHLAAMTAALVPASGSASNAGNSLKTIISRLMAPTKQAAEALGSMGINIESVEWQTANATERLEKMAKIWPELTAGQQSFVAAQVAGRRQQSRFTQLMTDMGAAQGFYAKALEATASQEKARLTYQKELLTFLESNPKKFDILTQSIKNYMARAILPLLPAIAGLLAQIAKLTKWFAELDPATQKFFLTMLVGLAVVGPFLRIGGALILLISQLGLAFSVAWKGVMLFGGGLKWLMPLVGTTAAGSFMGLKGAILGAGAGLLWLAKIILSPAMPLLHSLWLSVSTLVGVLWIDMVAALKSVIATMTTWIGVMAIDAVAAVRRHIAILLTWIGVMAIQVYQVLGSIIGLFMTWIGVHAIGAVQAISAHIATLTTWIGVMAIDAVAAVGRAVAAMALWIALNLHQVPIALGAAIQATLMFASSMTTSLVFAIRAAITNLVAYIAILYGKLPIALTSAIGVTWLWIRTMAVQFVASLRLAMTQMVAWAQFMAFYIVNSLRAGVTALVNYARIMATNFVLGLRLAISQMVAFASAMVGQVVMSVKLAIYHTMNYVRVLAAQLVMGLRLAIANIAAMAYSLLQYLVPGLLVAIQNTMRLASFMGYYLVMQARAAIVALAMYAGVLWAQVPAATAAAASAITALMVKLKALSILIMGPVLKALWGLALAIAGPIVSGIGAGLAAVAAIIGIKVGTLVAIIAAAAAVITAIFHEGIRDKVIGAAKWIASAIGDAVEWIRKGLSKLAPYFAQAITGILQVLRKGIEKVVDFLSYLNPFARHSPSLVDNVTAGVGVILDQYARLGSVGGMLRNAAAAHNSFLAATAPARANALAQKRGEQREAVAARAPAALPAFDRQVAHIDLLRGQMQLLEDDIAAQQNVVDAWQHALDRLGRELDEEKYKLEVLATAVGDLEDAIAGHKATIDKLVDTPLKGMHAMEDAIFANEMAQKRLRLELLKMEEAGQNVEDLKSKMAALNGEIEKLRSDREELRLAGAGSDVLGPIDQQITKLEQQRNALGESTSEVNKLEAKLKELERAGQILNLEKEVTFEPQVREIDILVNRMKEMPFEEIIAAIGREKAAIQSLQPELDRVKANYDAQAAVVEALERQHTGVSHRLDQEKAKLDDLKSTYDAIKDLVGQMEDALLDSVEAARELAGAAEDAASAAEQAQDAFDNLGDFEIPEGTGFLGREGGLAEIEDFNAALQEELDAALDGMDEFDMFAPIKEKWEQFVNWIGPKWEEFKDRFFSGLERIKGWFRAAWDNIRGWFGTGLEWLSTAWGAVWGAITTVLGTAWGIISGIFGAIVGFIAGILGPIFTWLWETIIQPVFSWIADKATWLWETVLQPVFTWLGEFFMGYVFPVFQLLWAIVEIVFTMIARLAMWLWDTIIFPVFEWVMEHIGDVGGVFQWLYDYIIKPVFTVIGAVIVGAWQYVIKPVFDALWGAIQWVGDKLGWFRDKIIDPVWGTIQTIIGKAWDYGIKPIWDNFFDAIEMVADQLGWFKDKIVDPVMNGVKNIFKTVWNAIASGLEGVINGFIKGFNLIVGVVRSIADFLNVDVSLSEMRTIDIPRFATGGTLPGSSPVGAGFMTDGPRAIVGEGRRGYPEYVIPTDPAHRRNAMRLFAALSRDIGLAGGGEIPDDFHVRLGSKSGGIAGLIEAAVNEGRRRAVDAAFFAASPGINALLDGIPNSMIRSLGYKIKDTIHDFARGDEYRFAKGGRFRVPRTPGGMSMRVGDGRNGEQVQVLPYDDDGGRGGNTYNFYGDLSFPNVRSGEDAEAFIKNLEGLANRG